jgi:hypothetical protein
LYLLIYFIDSFFSTWTARYHCPIGASVSRVFFLYESMKKTVLLYTNTVFKCSLKCTEYNGLVRTKEPCDKNNYNYSIKILPYSFFVTNAPLKEERIYDDILFKIFAPLLQKCLYNEYMKRQCFSIDFNAHFITKVNALHQSFFQSTRAATAKLL